MKDPEKVFGFLNNIICICGGKFSIFLREYLSSEVGMLAKVPNISDLIKRNFFQLNLSEINGTIK